MKTVLILLFLTINSLIFAIEFKQTVKNKKILVGDIINYEVEFPVSCDKIIFKEGNFSPFDLIGKNKTTKNNKCDFLFKLSIYQTGNFKIPPIKFTLNDKKQEQEITIPEKPLKVLSVLKGTQEDLKLKDIKPQVEIKEKNFIIAYVLLSILVLAVIIYLVTKKKPKLTPEKITIEKKLPAHEIAYKKLSELINKDLVKRGKYKEYAFELSEIIREFLGNRYKFDSIELTSDELIMYLKREPTFDRDKITILNNFLEDTDIIKFSKIEPESKELEDLTKTAFKIVNDLKINITD